MLLDIARHIPGLDSTSLPGRFSIFTLYRVTSLGVKSSITCRDGKWVNAQKHFVTNFSHRNKRRFTLEKTRGGIRNGGNHVQVDVLYTHSNKQDTHSTWSTHRRIKIFFLHLLLGKMTGVVWRENTTPLTAPTDESDDWQNWKVKNWKWETIASYSQKKGGRVRKISNGRSSATLRPFSLAKPHLLTSPNQMRICFSFSFCPRVGVINAISLNRKMLESLSFSRSKKEKNLKENNRK